jgi:hypothetical protein
MQSIGLQLILQRYVCGVMHCVCFSERSLSNQYWHLVHSPPTKPSSSVWSDRRERKQSTGTLYIGAGHFKIQIHQTFNITHPTAAMSLCCRPFKERPILRCSIQPCITINTIRFPRHKFALLRIVPKWKNRQWHSVHAENITVNDRARQFSHVQPHCTFTFLKNCFNKIAYFSVTFHSTSLQNTLYDVTLVCASSQVSGSTMLVVPILEKHDVLVLDSLQWHNI